jgi:ABC-type uncharacterized transport system permease subunit
MVGAGVESGRQQGTVAAVVMSTSKPPAGNIRKALFGLSKVFFNSSAIPLTFCFIDSHGRFIGSL